MLSAQPFQDFIQANRLFTPTDKVLLAISGGRDSVLMAHLFKTLGYSFGLAHVNFQLRSDESDADEVFCKALAAELDVPFYTTSFNTESYAETHQISIQMAARDLRYQWLEELREAEQYDLIATAHHQNDSVETILMNLVRGTGLSGLHGILPKRGHLVRPMLAFTRAQIDEIVEKEQLAYREDSSNQSTKYVRNKIRLEVVPKLKELNPALEETFEANARRFAELEELLQERVSVLRNEWMLPDQNGNIKLSLQALQQLKPLNTLLFELFRPYGFSAQVLEQLITCWNGHPGKVFESASHQILLDRDFLILSPIEQAAIPDTLISNMEGNWNWGKFHFNVELVDSKDFILQKNPQLAQMDAGLLQFPLKLRAWKKGDCFHPLGMKGQKKLSDYFIEQKIPLSQKKQIAILENGNGDIIWIAGKRIDERYKVTDNTKKVIIFEQNQEHVS